jgi:hypothetical protein
MPHQAVQLADGVNVNRTPALNQFGISASQLIRYQYDDTGAPMVQKLGGWAKYLTTTTPAPVRALWGWEDTNAVKRLAYGTQAFGGRSQLAVITSGVVQDITPSSLTTNSPPQASTTAGSYVVTITDPNAPLLTAFNTVYIQTYIAVGGLILFGAYPVAPVDATHYQIIAHDVLGNPQFAVTTDTAPAVETRQVTAGSAFVTITLNNHGYTVGANYAAVVPQVIGGLTILGNYTVQQVLSTSQFTILANTIATSSAGPTAINSGNAQYLYSFGAGPAQAGTGFGMGGFGMGPFGGTGQPATPPAGAPITADDWVLDNFGQILLACPITAAAQSQPIYAWDPLANAPQASVIPNAPVVNDGFFVAMPQRQIVCWGSTDTGVQDPLLVRWCDVSNYNSWVGLPTNQAGEYRLPRGSKIVGGIQGPQQGFLWTDLSVWSMQYIGLPYVYGFNEVATGCGLIGRKAAASANGVVYWMGPSQFFSLTSEGAQPLACPVWDVAFQDSDPTQTSKIRVAVNARFNEISWFIPTLNSGGEVGTFLKYNYALGWWDYGQLARSAWIDQSVLGAPIGADPNRLLIYQHETSLDADDQPLISSFDTGYFTMSEGDFKTFIDEIWPDARYGEYGSPQSATLQITLLLADFPEQAPVVVGPFICTQASTLINLRARARLFAMRILSSDYGSFWRLGRFRYRAQPAGRYG